MSVSFLLPSFSSCIRVGQAGCFNSALVEEGLEGIQLHISRDESGMTMSSSFSSQSGSVSWLASSTTW